MLEDPCHRYIVSMVVKKHKKQADHDNDDDGLDDTGSIHTTNSEYTEMEGLLIQVVDDDNDLHFDHHLRG